MDANKQKNARRQRRRWHIRKKVNGTLAKPRLSVFRSSRHMYCQLIDDFAGKTLAAVSTRTPAVREHLTYSGNSEAATILGKVLAETAKEKGISIAVMDRSGYKYHGRLKALTEAARKGGLSI